MGSRARIGAVVTWVGTLAVAGALLTAPGGCGGEPSCDSLCDNYLDLCVGVDADDADRNACLESCQGVVNDIPSSCGTARDEALSCLSDAESLECSNALASASCEAEVTELFDCWAESGQGSGSGSGTPSPSPSPGGGSGGAPGSGGGSSGQGGSAGGTPAPGPEQRGERWRWIGADGALR